MSQELLMKNIAYLKRSNKLTQDKFSKRLGLNIKTVGKWMEGLNYPTTKQLASISNSFKISIDDLVRKNLSTSKATSTRNKYYKVKDLLSS